MKWINIKDCVPIKSEKFLVTNGKEIEIMTYFGDWKGSHDWGSYNGNAIDVTHWMDLPEVPKE